MKTKLTEAQMRVAIAKDAIAQVVARQLKPMACNSYVELPRPMTMEKMVAHAEARTLKCTVCAVGGLFISSIAKFDDVKIPSSIAGQKHTFCFMNEKDHLMKFFEWRQLDKIESFFEGFAGSELYRHAVPDDRARLLVILRNIVRNRGLFKPTRDDLPKRKAVLL